MPARWLVGLLGADLLLIGAYAYGVATGHAMSRGLFYLVQLDGEANPPAWWAAAKLLAVGLVFLLLASRVFERDERVRPFRGPFLLLAAGFTFLSMDEAGTFHERLSRWMAAHSPEIVAIEQKIVQPLGFTRPIRGGGLWIVLYGLIAVAVLAYLAPHALRAWRTWRAQVVLFVVGFGLLVAGGVLTEILGFFVEIDTASRFLEIGVEEGLEMLGGSVLLVAAISLLSAAGERLAHADVAEPAVLAAVAELPLTAEEAFDADDVDVASPPASA